MPDVQTLKELSVDELLQELTSASLLSHVKGEI